MRRRTLRTMLVGLLIFVMTIDSATAFHLFGGFRGGGRFASCGGSSTTTRIDDTGDVGDTGDTANEPTPLGKLPEGVAPTRYALELTVVPTEERFSGVAFGSVGRVAPRFDELTPAGFRVAGGAGVRVAVRTESRANFRLDVAYGDELYVYFQFKEAF